MKMAYTVATTDVQDDKVFIVTEDDEVILLRIFSKIPPLRKN